MQEMKQVSYKQAFNQRDPCKQNKQQKIHRIKSRENRLIASNTMKLKHQLPTQGTAQKANSNQILSWNQKELQLFYNATAKIDLKHTCPPPDAPEFDQVANSREQQSEKPIVVAAELAD